MKVNFKIVTLQHVIHRQLVWPAVVEFQMTASQPVQYLLPDMQLNLVVLMEQWHGNLRLLLILMTTYKLTFSMSMLSVLLLLKEIHHPNHKLKNGPQSTNWGFLWMVPPFSLIKKIKLTRLVWYACVYKYLQQPKLLLVDSKLQIFILQITDFILQIQGADFNFISFHILQQTINYAKFWYINITFCLTGLSRKYRKNWHSEKQSKGICKCKVYSLSANKV